MITKTKFIDLLQILTMERVLNVREVTIYTDDETGEIVSQTNHRSNYTNLDDISNLPMYVQNVAQIVFALTPEIVMQG